MTFEEQLQIADGSRFQAQLGELVKKIKPKVVVETGFGVSTLFILKAIQDEGLDTMLYSIDKKPWYKYEITHPNNKLILARSIDALLPTYQNYGPFDIFLHDSNHDVKHQTYEYNSAWGFLKPGGYLVTDDHGWGGHDAWYKFLKENNLKAIAMGDAQYVQKPMNYGFVPAAKAVEVHQVNLHLAEAAEAKWLAMGNKNSEVFGDD